MRLYSLKITRWFICLLGLTVCSNGEGQWQLFRPAEQWPSLINSQFQNAIFIGTNQKRLTTCGNAGFDFPLLSFMPTHTNFTVGSGVVARIYLYMFPENRKFYVDNFYATFGVYFSNRIRQHLQWRLYPLYHLSAHLADGYSGDVDNDHIAVSNEMVYCALTYTCFKGMELLGGCGYYYHVCENRPLQARLDLDCHYRLFETTYCTPFVSAHNQLYLEGETRYGIQLSAGCELTNKNGRGLSIAARYFKNPHPGQYYARMEEGGGVEIIFLPSRER
jgi:hypothetical protein